MQFLTILAALSTAVFAADVCRPTNGDCNGSVVCCTGIQENNCCNLSGSTKLIRFKLPANSRAQGFTNSGCSAGGITTSNPNARTVCLSYGSNRQSGRWLTGLSSRVKRDPETEACAEPNVVLRVRDGVTTRVELRDGMTIEEALEVDGGEFVDDGELEMEYASADE